MSKTVFLAAQLRPFDEAEAMLLAQEDFVAEIQALVHDMMERKSVSRAELAKRLGVSKPRVTQFFSGDGSNLTARTIARIFHALDEKPELACEWTRRAAETRLIEGQRRSIATSGGVVIEMNKWQGDRDMSRVADSDCYEATDLSELVAFSRSRKPVNLSQAA